MVKKKTKTGRKRPSVHTRRIKVGAGRVKEIVITINQDIPKRKRPSKPRAKPKRKPVKKKPVKKVVKKQPEEDVNVLLVPIQKEKGEVEFILVPEKEPKIIEKEVLVPFPYTPQDIKAAQKIDVFGTNIKLKKDKIKPKSKEQIKLEKEIARLSVYPELEEDKKLKKELKDIEKLWQRMERERVSDKLAVEREQKRIEKQLGEESEIRVKKRELKAARAKLEEGDVGGGLLALGVKKKNLTFAKQLLEAGDTRAVKNLIKEDRTPLPYDQPVITLDQYEREVRRKKLTKIREKEKNVLRDLRKESKPMPKKKAKEEDLILEVVE